MAMLPNASCSLHVPSIDLATLHQNPAFIALPSGKIREIKTREEWDLRRTDIIKQFQMVAGELPRTDVARQGEYSILENMECEPRLMRQKIEFFSDPKGQAVRAWLIFPAQFARQDLVSEEMHKMPAVLCLHQTTSSGKDEPSGLSGGPGYALELASQGFVTLSLDYPGFGEYGSFELSIDSFMSGTMKAIVDNMAAVDILSSLPFVDSSRIGCLGHSLGAHNGMFTAMFDQRLKVIVASCGFTSFSTYHGGDLSGWSSSFYMPAIAEYYNNDPKSIPFDFHEIVAAMAPRPFLAISPVHDGNFAVHGVVECVSRALPVYELLGKASALSVLYPEHGHEFPADTRDIAYAFLATHL